ncbi:MAG TPA: hypothetical protein VMX94_04460 [Armatimonadota bacterium]|nr:hypothetical protein [Armatimonadota bacterium]
MRSFPEDNSGDARGNARSDTGDTFFLHFLDHAVINLFGLEMSRTHAELVRAFDRLARLSLVLCRDSVIIPASSCFEVEYGRNLIHGYPAFREAGYLRCAGRSYGPEFYLDKKRQQYAVEPKLFPLYFSTAGVDLGKDLGRIWVVKERSSTADISAGWRNAIVQERGPWKGILGNLGISFTSELETTLYSVPERLGDAAFIADFVVQALPQIQFAPSSKAEINRLITRDYILSFVRDLRATLLVDLDLFDTRPILYHDVAALSARRAARILRALGLYLSLMNCSESLLLQMKMRPEWDLFANDIIRRSGLLGPLWDIEELAKVKSLPQITTSLLQPRLLVDAIARVVGCYIRDVVSRIRPEALGSDARKAGTISEREVIYVGGIHFHGQVTVNGDVVNVEGNQYNIGTDPKDRVLEGIGAILRVDLEVAKTLLLIHNLAGPVERRGDISREEIATAVRDALRKDAVSEPKKQRLIGIMRDLAVGTSASMIAAGVVDGIKLLLGT